MRFGSRSSCELCRPSPLSEVWKVASSETWYYVYNADDERTFSYQGGTGLNRWTLRDLDGRVLREFSASNGTNWVATADWIWRGGSLLAAETTRRVRHFSLDHLGSPRLVTTSQGKQSAFHLYYPFGKEATSFNQDDVRAKFTGHERDLGVTGSDADDIDYMHARFYNGQIARFLSVDPLQGNPYRPQSMNRYAYVLGSPINFTDPWGLNADSEFTLYETIDSIANFFNIGPRNGPNSFPSFPAWPEGSAGSSGGGGLAPAGPELGKPSLYEEECGGVSLRGVVNDLINDALDTQKGFSLDVRIPLVFGIPALVGIGPGVSFSHGSDGSNSIWIGGGAQAGTSALFREVVPSMGASFFSQGSVPDGFSFRASGSIGIIFVSGSFDAYTAHLGRPGSMQGSVGPGAGANGFVGAGWQETPTSARGASPCR